MRRLAVAAGLGGATVLLGGAAVVAGMVHAAKEQLRADLDGIKRLAKATNSETLGDLTDNGAVVLVYDHCSRWYRSSDAVMQNPEVLNDLVTNSATYGSAHYSNTIESDGGCLSRGLKFEIEPRNSAWEPAWGDCYKLRLTENQPHGTLTVGRRVGPVMYSITKHIKPHLWYTRNDFVGNVHEVSFIFARCVTK